MGVVDHTKWTNSRRYLERTHDRLGCSDHWVLNNSGLVQITQLICNGKSFQVAVFMPYTKLTSLFYNTLLSY